MTDLFISTRQKQTLYRIYLWTKNFVLLYIYFSLRLYYYTYSTLAMYSETRYSVNKVPLTVSQKRVHMFFSISLIGLYLSKYKTYEYDLSFTRKVCITASWPYIVYYIILSIEWDNQKLAQPTHVDPFFAIKFCLLIFE